MSVESTSVVKYAEWMGESDGEDLAPVFSANAFDGTTGGHLLK